MHRRRCGRCRHIVRAAVPVLRNADRSSEPAAQDTAGDYPEYHAPGDDRPDPTSDIDSDDALNGIPDRFTLGVRDSLPPIALQHFSFRKP